MAGILVYALHDDEGNFNKNSLGAVSEGARLAGELGTECHAIVVGDKAGLSDELCASLGAYGAAKVHRVEGPEGLAQPVVDAMAKVISDNDLGYALFGGGLLGFELAPAWPRASTPASAWRSPTCASRTASSSPSARSSRTPRSPTSTTARTWA